VEIWREEWLENLEQYRTMTNGNLWLIQKAHDEQIALIGCMRAHGSLEDILTMIENGDQGKHLQERVRAIRQDSYRMQFLQDLWTDESLTHLMDDYV
jgi:hypothetical protein